jgi:SET domain-containing protein
MTNTLVLPRIARRRSKVQGFGVFSGESINKNKRIIQYEGELITHKQSDPRAARYLRRHEIWCFTVNRRWVRDAHKGGNIARFINHGCVPNCYAQIMGQTIWIRAARNIKAGEELTYHYHTDGNAELQCLCRPGCKYTL